jgi:hypothetical protein
MESRVEERLESDLGRIVSSLTLAGFVRRAGYL